MADIAGDMKSTAKDAERKAYELKGQAKARLQQLREQQEQRSANEE